MQAILIHNWMFLRFSRKNAKRGKSSILGYNCESFLRIFVIFSPSAASHPVECFTQETPLWKLQISQFNSNFKGILNIFLNTTNKMQGCTIFFIVVSALHVSSGFSAHHQGLKSCTCSIAVSPTLAVAANKSDKYPMLHVQFLNSWRWAEKPVETCRALTTIKKNA